MTCVNALVLILRHSDAPLKTSKNTKISRLFIGSDVLGFFFMIYDDLSLSQNIERINLWREVTALYFNSLIHESATKKKCNVSFLELHSNKKRLE